MPRKRAELAKGSDPEARRRCPRLAVGQAAAGSPGTARARREPATPAAKPGQVEAEPLGPEAEPLVRRFQVWNDDSSMEQLPYIDEHSQRVDALRGLWPCRRRE